MDGASSGAPFCIGENRQVARPVRAALASLAVVLLSAAPKLGVFDTRVLLTSPFGMAAAKTGCTAETPWI